MTDTGSLATVPQPHAGLEVSRRKFISGLAVIIATAAAGALAVPVTNNLAAVRSPGPAREGWLPLCAISALAPGRPAGFPFVRIVRDGLVDAQQSGIAYVVSDDGSHVRVLANICPHNGCRVTWQAQLDAFACPCHGGRFDSNGRVLAGLPPGPLPELPSQVVNGLVQIRLEV